MVQEFQCFALISDLRLAAIQNNSLAIPFTLYFSSTQGTSAVLFRFSSAVYLAHYIMICGRMWHCSICSLLQQGNISYLMKVSYLGKVISVTLHVHSHQSNWSCVRQGNISYLTHSHQSNWSCARQGNISYLTHSHQSTDHVWVEQGNWLVRLSLKLRRQSLWWQYYIN